MNNITIMRNSEGEGFQYERSFRKLPIYGKLSELIREIVSTG
jgi:hypothetical protein